MARFERIPFDPGSWAETLAGFPDRTVFQTSAWLSFLAETQKGELVIAALKDGNQTTGYFAGLMLRKFGMRILGSPLRGWSTPYLGFNLLPAVPRRLAAEALSDFAFKELGCIYCEVTDPQWSSEDVGGLGFREEEHATLEIDLTQSEEALLSHMTKSCRWTIKKAEKNGVRIEAAVDAEFADEYFAQLKDVFAKQGMVPYFGVERVRALLRHLLPTGALLALRARDPLGRCIATGVYVADHETAFYWGGASWRRHQNLYPNELLQWHAIRYWKQHGIRCYNMVGTMDFKRKFGGAQTAVPMVSKARNWLVSQLSFRAPQFAKAALRLPAKLKLLTRSPPS